MRSFVKVLRVGLALGFAMTTFARPSEGAVKDKPTAEKNGWCAPEFESVAGGSCYLDGGSTTTRRTLVIFLHGAIAKNTTWSWNHERMVMKLAKAHHVEVLFPKSPTTDAGYVWPGKLETQRQVEQDLIDGWMAGKRALEKRDGRSFDEVFVMGFSSGAYFTSSLAMRGRLDVDGYAVFAGGQPMPRAPEPTEHFAPVYVGVCAADETTAAHSRAFGSSLSMAGIPRMVGEQDVGHGLSDVHFAQALGFLRRTMKPRVT